MTWSTSPSSDWPVRLGRVFSSTFSPAMAPIKKRPGMKTWVPSSSSSWAKPNLPATLTTVPLTMPSREQRA